MGSVVGCGPDQVRFSYRMDDDEKEYFGAFTVTGYNDGIVYLDGNGISLDKAPYAAIAFLNSTTSIGTAKRILNLRKEKTVKAVCIDLMQKDKLRRVLVPKDAETEFSIEA